MCLEGKKREENKGRSMFSVEFRGGAVGARLTSKMRLSVSAAAGLEIKRRVGRKGKVAAGRHRKPTCPSNMRDVVPRDASHGTIL